MDQIMVKPLAVRNVTDDLDALYRCCGQQEYWWKLFKQ